MESQSHADEKRSPGTRTATALALGAGLAAGIGIAAGRPGIVPNSATGVLGVLAAVLVMAAGGFLVGRWRFPSRTAGDSYEVAALAHDLRAPLATARTLMQLLQSGALGTLTAEAMDTTSRASGAVARAQAVLESTLRPSELTESAPTTDLEVALDRALQSVAGGIAQSGAVVERSELPIVRADAIALERVLVNLVVNAIVHARPGETPRIEVDARQEGPGWLISVRDHGPGVPDQIRERAFEPGVRGFAPHGPAGFGLGLSTVRRLVEQQGGRAWIDPDTSEGTCVRMLLPAA